MPMAPRSCCGVVALILVGLVLCTVSSADQAPLDSPALSPPANTPDLDAQLRAFVQRIQQLGTLNNPANSASSVGTPTTLDGGLAAAVASLLLPDPAAAAANPTAAAAAAAAAMAAASPGQGQDTAAVVEASVQRMRALLSDGRLLQQLLPGDDGTYYTAFGEGLGFDASAISALAILVGAAAAAGAPVLGVIAGAIQGAVAGPIQGRTQGPVQGAIQGVVQAPIQGAIQGGVQGTVQGVVQGVVQAAVGTALKDIRANPIGGLLYAPVSTIAGNVAGSLTALSSLITDVVQAEAVAGAAAAGSTTSVTGRRKLSQAADATTPSAADPDDGGLAAVQDAISGGMDKLDLMTQGMGKVLEFWS